MFRPNSQKTTGPALQLISWEPPPWAASKCPYQSTVTVAPSLIPFSVAVIIVLPAPLTAATPV